MSPRDLSAPPSGLVTEHSHLTTDSGQAQTRAVLVIVALRAAETARTIAGNGAYAADMATRGDLVDPFGRRVRDLRLSITDRCNFRCTYCMPAEGMPWLPREEILTYEEQARIAAVCVERFGFDVLRITGGEPTIRAHLPRLITMLAPLGVDVAMTTNGVKPRRWHTTLLPPACNASTCRSTRFGATGSSHSLDATSSTACWPASTRRAMPDSSR